jgi:hypothetical protein
MSSKKYTDNVPDLNKAYELNEIELKGIAYFAIGLFLLIVITFGLMWALLNVMKDFREQENARQPNPMMMSDRERLPPEPRLQLAPGFGVESDKGWVNMELGAPQAEYWELKKQWQEMWEHGRKDPKTGAVAMMPIDDAIDRFVSQNHKAKAGEDAAKQYEQSHVYYSDSSSGRLASEKRR